MLICVGRWVSAAGAGDEGGHDVCGVPVEESASSVVARVVRWSGCDAGSIWLVFFVAVAACFYGWEVRNGSGAL